MLIELVLSGRFYAKYFPWIISPKHQPSRVHSIIIPSFADEETEAKELTQGCKKSYSKLPNLKVYSCW